MKRISDKRRKRIAEVAPIRAALRAKAECCMICGHSPKNPRRGVPRGVSELCVHEISNGPLRGKSLDKPFACLVLCCYCNLYEVTNKKNWPEARQLAVLLEKSPEDYDLRAYLELTNPRAPRRIEQSEVDQYLPNRAA